MYNDLELIDILIVDDDPVDTELTMEVLKMSKLKLNISVVNDGGSCMEYLDQAGEYESARRPDLIFLDLNMPRKDERATLREIKSDANLKMIPVVILTTSSEDEDVMRSYTEGANCYIQKPVDFENMQQVIGMVESFWLTIVKLPNQS